MEHSTGFNLKALVGKNALEAYDTYIKLKELTDSVLFANAQEETMIYDDYNLRDYGHPMGLVLKEN
jgi:hypothetical protein